VAEESDASDRDEVVTDIRSAMDGPPFQVPVLLNDAGFVDALIDSGCQCFSAVRSDVAERLGGEFMDIPPRSLQGAEGQPGLGVISRLWVVPYDIDGWRSQLVAYVVPRLAHDLILGDPWLRREGVVIDSERRRLTIRAAGGLVVKELQERVSLPTEQRVTAAEYDEVVRSEKNNNEAEIRICFISLQEITQALITTTIASLKHDVTSMPGEGVLPPELEDFRDLFDPEKAASLPSHRGRLDHHIRLRKDDRGRDPELPWGPLYPMTRDQLLELRRQITDLMDKGWIRASASAAGAPVLLIKKPTGGWRLCVDYRGLNKITVPDRYPLPLIKETLRTLGQASWFTKVDVRSAFHRLRMAEGDEDLTAFRTRFGLFEWTVCPMGLAGAPASFQRYINGALGDTLGQTSTAYLDDVLTYSMPKSKAGHYDDVRKVLTRLRDAGLSLDLKKCAFATKEVKYLGYVIKAGDSVRPDPDKLRAVHGWETPTNVKGVRSFLGFANFYRDFIEGFSAIAEPLHKLTGRNTPFQWGVKEAAAFAALKNAFTSKPILAQWNPDLDTLVETDCSGTALGGCLSQWHNGVLRPVAYHSAALTKEQRNYTIHDKELLAVVRCLEAWAAELRGVSHAFTILTDHKNLEYFTRKRVLSERQSHWAELLSQYAYKLEYRPGRLAARPDALSRRLHQGNKTSQVVAPLMTPISIATGATRDQRDNVSLPLGCHIFADRHMQELWDAAMQEDPSYRVRLQAVQSGATRFPPEANTTQQIVDCGISAHKALLWRGVTWLPSWEPLTTTVIQKAHESPMSGHPGKNTTFHMLRRDYHWDGMSQDVSRFVRNCHCAGAHAQRRKRQGLLRPIPVADRYWTQISMDFMVDLPAATSTAPRYLLVITDRLSKYVQLEAMTSMEAAHCAATFKQTWWRFRGFPTSIITDRGSNWLGDFWTSLCEQVGIDQLLSTSHHPQTDGGTERANQEVQSVLRLMVNFEQTNWPECLAACQLALNNRDSSVTGVSPNLLLNGFAVDTLQKVHIEEGSRHSQKGAAVQFLHHLKEGAQLAQAAIAFTQQRQQESTNRARRPAERFRVGDKVWFSMRNVKTNRPKKKLDWLQRPYTVIGVPNALNVTLDLPGHLHRTVHVDLVERAASDPLPSQRLLDARPGPELVVEEEDPSLNEYAVEQILRVKNARGRGKKKALVKWTGYLDPTWEPVENVKDTLQWQQWQEKQTSRSNPNA